MGGWIRRAFRSLELRLLLLPALTIGAALTVQALLSSRSTRESVADFVHGELLRSSALIRSATHDGMLLNRLDDVQATIERLTATPDVVAIRVYDKEGVIALSGAPDERAGRIDPSSDLCLSCHVEGRTREDAVLERSGLYEVPGRPAVLRHLSVIANESSCARSGCHASPADRPVLGVLDVEMSMDTLHASLGAANRHLVLTTIVLILVGGFAVVAALRRLVHRPVKELREGTRRIAAGDLETELDVPGTHELARLAEAFNGMMADLRQARHAVLDWSSRLEEKVAEKTEHLRHAQRQVLHMEKMASLGKLSATVAHELNNPLGGMLTYARLVKRELESPPLDDETRAEVCRYLDLIDRECARCGTIVHNLLTFARHTGTEMQPAEVAEIVARSVALVRHHVEMWGVELVLEGPAGGGTIVADAGQIQQALVALLVNAVEAMRDTPQPERRLTVRVSGDEEHVEIAIADRGIGIAPEVLQRIFEPFFSTKGGDGVGLGLAVVYGIVNRHDGSIAVESEPGRGTTFRLRLPRRPQATAPPASDATTSPSGNEEAEPWPITSRAS